MTCERTVLFNLWVDCPNHCSFCCSKFRDRSDKIMHLAQVMEQLDDLPSNCVVGFLGGELFCKQTPTVREMMKQLWLRVRELCDKGQIVRVQPSTALLYSKMDLLYECIDILEPYLLLCTSWDAKYRFKNNSALQLWSYNMTEIHRKYPNLRIHVETILTNALLKLWESKLYDEHGFQVQYNAELSFLEPRAFDVNMTKQQVIQQLPDFLPERQRFLDFAQHILARDYKKGPLTRQNFMSCNLFTDELRMLGSDDQFHIVTGVHDAPNNLFRPQAGRTFEKLNYCDSDAVLYDDLLALKSLF